MPRPIRLALLWLTLACGLARAEPFSFAVLGDMPYSDAERAQVVTMLEDIADSGAAFAVHVGDIKSGTTPCSDALFEDRRALFDASRIPFVLVPGDNEWTDCHRHAAGAHDPAERLEKLRELFFDKPSALGRGTLALQRQSDANYAFGAYREHLRWSHGPLLFVTVHVVGSDNNRGRGAIASEESRHRMAAVRDWLESSATRASAAGAAGMVILMQANPDFEADAQGQPVRAYADFLAALRDLLDRFKGEVLVVHGDTHTMRIDRPLRGADGEFERRLRRVEVYGSPVLGWVQVTVDAAGERLFRIRPQPLTPDIVPVP